MISVITCIVIVSYIVVVSLVLRFNYNARVNE
jgi:hypothetical protein